MKKTLHLLFLILLSLPMRAWEGMAMPQLHVDGRNLKDDAGHTVTLHGFVQTYSPWFNERGTKWNNYNVSACLRYNQGLIDRMLSGGWKVNLLRLHMDPYWSNTLRLFDESSYWSTPASVKLGNSTRTVIDLTSLTKGDNGPSLDLSHIYIAGFWSYGFQPISIKSVYLTDVTGSTGIVQPTLPTACQQQRYSIGGIPLPEKTDRRGIYIVNGKKMMKY